MRHPEQSRFFQAERRISRAEPPKLAASENAVLREAPQIAAVGMKPLLETEFAYDFAIEIDGMLF